MGLSDSPSCRRCGAEDGTLAHTLCECEALASHRHVYLGSFFFGAKGHQEYKPGGHLELQKSNGAPINWYGVQRARRLRPRNIGTVRSQTQS